MKKVLLICGGKSTEHKVSLMSAKSILENIDYKNFEITTCIIDLNNNWYEYLGEAKNILKWKGKNKRPISNIIEYIKYFDIVFPITHGNNGEDGKLQGMLDLFNIKYVGCKTLSSAICMDKAMSKVIFKHLNIPQVPFIIIKNKNYDLDEIINQLDFPLIVKPANGGSSIGINKATNARQLKKAINYAFKFDNKIIVEKFIKARELECAFIEDKNYFISEIGEIVAANDFYDYDAKYENKDSYTIIPAELNSNISEKIKTYAKEAIEGLDCKGLARIDFFYDEDNDDIYLNEINTLPGFTTISMYPQLFINQGITYQELITKLLNNC